LALANSCEKLKQSEEALTFFNKAFEEDKKNIDAILGIGNLKNKLGKYEDAKKMFNKVLEIEPNSYDANYGLGNCEINIKNYENAKIYFDKAININPKNPIAYIGSGNINCHFGKYQQAIDDYNISITLKSENSAAYEGRGIAYFRLNQNYNAVESFTKIEITDKNYTFSYDALVSKGFANYNLENFKEAKKDFEKSIILEPNKSSGHNGLGCTNYELRDYGTAVQNFNTAVQFSPNDDVILTNRGNALYRVQDYTKAINDFNKAVLINPINEHAYNGLGICNHQNDKYEDAIKYIQKAIDILPFNKDLYRNLGISRGHWVKNLRKSKKDTLAIEQYQLMLQDHKKSFNLGLDYSVMQINLGYLHSVLEEFDVANDYFNSVRNRNYFAYVDNNKGVVLALREEGKYIDEAYTLFEDAVKEDDKRIALSENAEKYEAPRFNKDVIGRDIGKDIGKDVSLDNLSSRTKIKEKYYNTYFYYALMRYNPPPTEHNFPIEINLKMPNPSTPNINYILYKDMKPCYKVKRKKVKTKRIKNKKKRKNNLLNCPVNF
jgi:tetratricopeptide (TPR) repeat protein